MSPTAYRHPSVRVSRTAVPFAAMDLPDNAWLLPYAAVFDELSPRRSETGPAIATFIEDGIDSRRPVSAHDSGRRLSPSRRVAGAMRVDRPRLRAVTTGLSPGVTATDP
jgi:hypothetical protein